MNDKSVYIFIIAIIAGALQTSCDYPGSGAVAHPPMPEALIGRSEHEIVEILGSPLYENNDSPTRREVHFMFLNRSTRKNGVAGYQIFFERDKAVEVHEILNSM